MSLLMRSSNSILRRATLSSRIAPSISSFQSHRLFSSVPKLSNENEPIAVLSQAFDHFGDDIAISFSGAEDVILVDFASKTGKKFRVFSLDTGRLNPETYELFQAVEQKYGINIEYTFPDAKAVEDLVHKKGQFSFRKDGHGECCGVRKVAPLVKKLSTLRAWVTGQRKDQSPDTRAAVPVVQEDPVFKGTAGPLVKFNPVTGMTSAEVWNYIRQNDVPYNALHERGMISIGCAPCTRAILPGMHEREGRWWWESAQEKECGLHEGNKADFKKDEAPKKFASASQ